MTLPRVAELVERELGVAYHSNPLGRLLHVVWDNLGAHHKAERFIDEIAWPWARFHRLLAYAPRLNPVAVEHVWSTSKWGPLANAPPDDLGQLSGQIDDELKRHANEQTLLCSHFRWAGIGLN